MQPNDKQSDPPSEDRPSVPDDHPEAPRREQIETAVTNESFTEWYDEQQYAENILQGKPYFNGPSPPKDADRHSPSKLLQCHRKAAYSRQNAPREGTPPEGLFWIGTAFEEDVIVPYLQDTIPDDLYVQNSLWIDTTIATDDTELRLRGSTDPTIVTGDADPLVVTEIKTTTSLDHLSKPKVRHKAQLHAYLYALDEEHDHSVSDGLLVYGSRKTLDLKVFSVTFDAAFWQSVVEWMAEQTEYEQAGELPPATPERDWECNYCSFKHRCGEADTPYSDMGYDGLLPGFTGYDEQNLGEYLAAHESRDARLTPTLAHHYPELVEEYGAYDWSCSACGAQYAWHGIDWDGNTDDRPFCPECAESGTPVILSGPEPGDQLNCE